MNSKIEELLVCAKMIGYTVECYSNDLSEFSKRHHIYITNNFHRLEFRIFEEKDNVAYYYIYFFRRELFENFYHKDIDFILQKIRYRLFNLNVLKSFNIDDFKMKLVQEGFNELFDNCFKLNQNLIVHIDYDSIRKKYFIKVTSSKNKFYKIVFSNVGCYDLDSAISEVNYLNS
jgi:hypothetical protein